MRGEKGSEMVDGQMTIGLVEVSEKELFSSSPLKKFSSVLGCQTKSECTVLPSPLLRNLREEPGHFIGSLQAKGGDNATGLLPVRENADFANQRF